MANKQLSYDYQNTVRDMSEVFSTIVKQNPVTSSLLTVSNEAFESTKLEWLDDLTAPLVWTVGAGGHTSGSGTVPCGATAGLETGMIVQFEKVTSGVRSTLIAQVGAITADTSFAITVYGGSTDETIAANSKIQLLSKPVNEGTDATVSGGYEPTPNYNYSQIFDKTAKVSGTALNTKMYGINTTLGQVLNFQIEKKLQEIAYEVGASSLNMPRVQRTSGTPGTMGGWFWFIKQGAGNSVNGGGVAITSAILNQGFELARNNGGMPATIVANPIQAKYLSALNTIGNVQIMRDETTAGRYVKNFVTDFGDMASIIYSYDMDKEKIAITTPEMIKLRPMANRAFTDKDATPPGADYVARRILGEYSLEIRNASASHTYIYNLLAV